MTPPRSAAPEVLTHVQESPIGSLVATWTERGLYSLQSVADDTIQPDWNAAGSHHSEALAAILDDYFATGRSAFDSVRVDETGWTPFAQAVYRQCRKIPTGTTLTYGDLAARAGNRSASRAVGALMARNRILLVIPCHRVVSSGGGLRGFSAAGGLTTKQYLLDLESV